MSTNQFDPESLTEPTDRIAYAVGRVVELMDRAANRDQPLRLSVKDCRAFVATINREMERI
jgi:hypothetical protein